MSTSVFSLRLPEELMEEVKVIAKEEERSVNSMLIYIVKEWLMYKGYSLSKRGKCEIVDK